MADTNEMRTGFSSSNQELKELLAETKSHYKKLYESLNSFCTVLKKYIDENKTESVSNAYKEYFEKMQNQKESMSTDSKSYKDKFGDRIGVHKWSYAELGKINNSQYSDEEKAEMADYVQKIKESELTDITAKEWLKRGEKIGDIFSGTLDGIIKDMGNFDGNIKKMIQNLMSYTVKELGSTFFTKILSEIGSPKNDGESGDNSWLSNLTSIFKNKGDSSEQSGSSDGGELWSGIKDFFGNIFGKLGDFFKGAGGFIAGLFQKLIGLWGGGGSGFIGDIQSNFFGYEDIQMKLPFQDLFKKNKTTTFPEDGFSGGILGGLLSSIFNILGVILKPIETILTRIYGALSGDMIMEENTEGGRDIFGNIFGYFRNMFSRGNTFHSGGVVPSGANYSLPGTQEQLALLKGGERVLSPGENVQYENDSRNTPVVFNNFNIKAWDSKDVQRYLLENRSLLNSITFQGIKDNDQMLRHIVRNA